MNLDLRSLFIAAKAVLAPKPEAKLPLIRHTPLEGNDDLEYWSDRKYLQDLKSAITDEIIGGAFVFEVPPPVLSEKRLAELKRGLDAAAWEFSNIFEDAA